MKTKTKLQAWTVTAIGRKGKSGVHVSVTWTGPAKLDKPTRSLKVFPDTAKGNNLAGRLVGAINAGKVYKVKTARITKKDGKTYIKAKRTVKLDVVKDDLKTLKF